MTIPYQQPDPANPTPPQQPPWPPHNQPAPPPKKSRGRLIAILAAAFVGLAVIVGGTVAFTLAATGNDRTPPVAGDGLSAWEREQAAGGELPSVEDETLPDPEPTPTSGVTLKPADIELSLKTVDKQCFGSAGCSITAQVRAAGKEGPVSLFTHDTWLVTYEITGVQDGPMVGSFEITEAEYTVNEEFFNTASAKSKVSIKVIDVEKVGI